MTRREEYFWASVARVPLRVHWPVIAEVATRVLEFGDPAEPPLIMVHGTGGHAEAFVHNVGELARRRRVVLYDLPAHGWSGAPGMACEIDDYIRHLLGLGEALGIPEFDLCGQSLGGWIAARLAARHPERVRRLVLVGAGGMTPAVDGMSSVRRLSRDAVRAPTQTSVRERLAVIMGRSEHATDELVACRQAIYAQDDSQTRMEQALVLQDPEVRARNLLTRHELAGIRCRALVLSGDEDHVVTPQTSRRLHEWIPDSDYAEIGPAGHWPQFEQPEQFNQLVTRFLDEPHTEERSRDD